MFERFRTPREDYERRLSAALRMERTLIEILELGVRNSSDRGVKELLGSHLEDSREHVETLESIFLLFGWGASDSPCPAMEALEKECKSGIKRAEGPVVGVVILQIALEAEHLRIGVYENLIIHANAMDRPEVVERLQRNLGSGQAVLDSVKLLLRETLGAGPTKPV